jgi:hypothetical protein
VLRMFNFRSSGDEGEKMVAEGSKGEIRPV